MSSSSLKPNLVSTWISSLKRTFHPYAARGGPPGRAAHDRGHRAIQGGVPGYAPCKLYRGSCTRRTLHDSIFSEESRVHRSCRRHPGAWDRSKHCHFHDRAWSAAAVPRLSKTRSADVSDRRISGHWGHPKCALCARVHGVPPDEPVIRGGWRLFDRRRGVHNRRGQPHCRGSTSAGALDLRRCPFAQGARYSAGAGTLLQRRRNRPLDRDATATDRDSLARIVANSVWTTTARWSEGRNRGPPPRNRWHYAARGRRHG